MTPFQPQADSEQALALKLYVVLSRAFRAVDRHSGAHIAQHDLSPGEFSIMEALFSKGPLLLGEVQRKVLVSSGGVTYLVDRLQAAGLVERRECAEDRRARYAALTPRGEALMERMFPFHVEVLERAVEGLSSKEKKVAIDLLRKLGTTAAARPLPSRRTTSAVAE
jgi:MarR family transcriptional regulator, 2-MHQ and catechol-resistance regulon repressor